MYSRIGVESRPGWSSPSVWCVSQMNIFLGVLEPALFVIPNWFVVPRRWRSSLVLIRCPKMSDHAQVYCGLCFSRRRLALIGRWPLLIQWPIWVHLRKRAKTECDMFDSSSHTSLSPSGSCRCCVLGVNPVCWVWRAHLDNLQYNCIWLFFSLIPAVIWRLGFDHAWFLIFVFEEIPRQFLVWRQNKTTAWVSWVFFFSAWSIAVSCIRLIYAGEWFKS